MREIFVEISHFQKKKCKIQFPIQSNPGGATAELIHNGENGLLIEDCEDIEEIKRLILKVIQMDFFKLQNDDLIASLDFEFVKEKVLETYNKL